MTTAIAWAQFQLKGGWKNLLGTTLAYALVVGGIIGVTVAIEPQMSTRILHAWTVGLLGFQVLILLLFGGSRVGAAVRADLDQRMIESHRLMPVPAGAAVGGYIIGSASQAAALGAVTLLLGMVTSAGGGIMFEQWLLANGILILFALFVWVVLAYASFLTKHATTALVVLVVAIFISEGQAALLVPALMVLASPLIGESIFEMRPELSWVHGVSIAAQATLGAILFAAAALRYRRDDVPALGVTLGMALLGAWVVVSAIGLVWWEEFAPAFLLRPWGTNEPSVLAPLMVTMLMAVIPVANAARADAMWRREVQSYRVSAGRVRVPTGDSSPVGSLSRPLSPLAVALAATLICVCLAVAVPAYDLAQYRPAELATLAGLAGAAILAFLLAMNWLLRWNYRAVERGALIGFMWISLTWLGPLAVDYVRHGLSGGYDEQVLGIISSFSPVGALIGLYGTGESFTVAGLAGQYLLAGIPAALYYSSSRRTARTTEDG